MFLQQLKTYGTVGRDPRGRIISVAFLSLIKADQTLQAATDAQAAKWHRFDQLPPLAFDHQQIVDDALKQLHFLIQTTTIAAQILPKRFTLTQMQELYQQILGRSLDKRNFRKRIAELDLLKETSQTFLDGAHRPAKLYEFKQRQFVNFQDKIHIFLA